MRQILTAPLLLVSMAATAQTPPVREASAEDRQKIDQAIPAQAPAKPGRARRLLLLNVNVNDTGRRPDVHVSLPHGNYAIEAMGKKTRAYTAVLSTDIQSLRPENLRQFDAICFNNTTGVLTEDPVLRQSLLDFVREGKGFVGIHAAGATFVQYPKYDQFPAFGEMLGGYEDGGHPWKPNETITIKLDDPAHPVNAAFGGKGFEIQDEVFQFRHGYSREKLRVLLSIDTQKTDVDPKRRFLPERAEDQDFAMSWVRAYGKGRVFYTSFGHNPSIFWNAPILQHLLAGIQFALGDLKASAEPSAPAKAQ